MLSDVPTALKWQSCHSNIHPLAFTKENPILLP